MHVRRSAKRATVIGLLVLTLAAGGTWLAGSVLIRPHREDIGPIPGDLPLEDVTIRSSSGAILHGWYATGCPGRGAVLLLHGVRANRLAMLPRARWLHSRGYAVLLIDFQASGESSGRWITFGAYEADDAVAATTYLRSRAPAERVAVIGTSMGGAAALLARPALRVDAMVLEQVYPDIGQAVKDRLQIHLGGANWLAPWMLKWFTVQTGVRADTLRPIDHIARITTPKLLIVGSDDRHTRLPESLSMYEAAAEPKELWIVPGALHVDLYRYDTDDYRWRVGRFLSERINTPSSEVRLDATCSAKNPM